MPTPSIRTLVAAAMVAPILGVSFALAVLFTLTSGRIAEQLGASLAADATARVEADLDNFLAQAVRLSDLYTRRLRDGALSAEDLAGWETDELHDLLTTPDVASICFGTPRGDATWLLRAHERLELGRVVGGRNDEAVEFVRDPDGTIHPEPIRVYRYDPRERPWYRLALTRSRPIWTPIYFWFGPAGADSETGTGLTRAVHDDSGNLLGVLVIDVTLHGLSSRLATLPVAREGFVYLLDGDALLVAASDGHVNSESGRRLRLSESDSSPARAVAEALAADPFATTFRRLELEHGPARANISYLKRLSTRHPGIDWRLVTVVPESAFLAEATAMRSQAVWISALAALCGTLLGLALARRLSDPLVALAGQVRRLGGGDFDARTEVRTARELRDLSAELNRMAVGLKRRMELEQSLAVATQVQQGLLPEGPPAIPGLDLAAMIRYCEGAGGDYFDYIHLPGPPGEKTLIAVGDVMGHGVGAALLMTTARASLRAHAASCTGLGDLLTRVNADLVRDSRRGRFMTMLLALADPAAGTLRWASAGHDRPVIHHPTLGLIESSGGGVPLGVLPDAVYSDIVVCGLAPGTLVALATDGIWEARNAQREFFSHARFLTIIRENASRPATDVVGEVARALDDFVGTRPLQDDATLVAVRFTSIASG